MSTLIPDRQWDDIRRMSSDEFRQLHSCEVFQGEDYVGAWIPRNSRDEYIASNIRVRAEALGYNNNSVIVKKDMPFREAVRIAETMMCDECEFVAKSPFGLKAHKRKHEKEKVATLA